jgi:SAM-dependent methyltransferase
MAIDPAYETFWKRKQLLMKGRRRFPVQRWWYADGLCEIERVYFEAVRDASNLLDVGAGDLRVMRKLQSAGYRGTYHTQDIGEEGEYTYRDLSEINQAYGAILCLDVIEHLDLREGLLLLKQMIALLEPGGVLVLQTPNAYYIPHPLSWDMTHIHVYNLHDLWAHLTCDGLEVTGYRVLFEEPDLGPVQVLRTAITSYVKKKILGCDYANNIALIVRKPKTAPAVQASG